MKTKLAAAALLLASTSLSFAADLATKAPAYAPVPVWSWTGFYLGAHVGAGWGTTESTVSSVSTLGVVTPVGLSVAQNSRSGVLGGGQLGYNWQTGWAVFGVQGDIAGMDVNGTTPCFFLASCTAKSDWLATVTGRFGGVVADRTLVYVKGGAAWMHTDHSFSVPAAGLGLGAPGLPGGSVSGSTTALGWVLGLGAEYAFDHNWSAFIEYDYIDFDKKNVALDFGVGVGAPGLAVANVDFKNKLSIAKVGINYKFGGPVVARY
jgi:outer membrane immunogenic protein